MHQILSAPTAAKDHPDLLTLYFDDAQKVKPVGTLIANPDYAKTLQSIALKGPSAIWADGASTDFLAAVQKGYKPSLMNEDDLKNYPVEEREPLCGPYLRYSICVMAPPSFGGVVVLQVLQMLAEKSSLGTDFNQPEFAHAFAEAGKLAQVDRHRYVADPAFFKVPAKALVNPAYVKQRAALIQSNTLPSYAPGQPEAMLAESSGQALGCTRQCSQHDHHQQFEFWLAHLGARLCVEQRHDQLHHIAQTRRNSTQQNGAPKKTCDVHGTHHGF
jgi:gamma-glutamyltranspeptidase/glutathione hydrolase